MYKQRITFWKQLCKCQSKVRYDSIYPSCRSTHSRICLYIKCITLYIPLAESLEQMYKQRITFWKQLCLEDTFWKQLCCKTCFQNVIRCLDICVSDSARGIYRVIHFCFYFSISLLQNRLQMSKQSLAADHILETTKQNVKCVLLIQRQTDRQTHTQAHAKKTQHTTPPHTQTQALQVREMCLADT